ncbi:hypothetical protein [Mucilaginibacter terrenus]|nr:hypothetical protein [Mucilaginibacter terrenus]
MEPRMLHHFSLRHGRTSAVIPVKGQTSYKLIGICKKQLRCTGHATGLIVPDPPNEKQKPKVDMYRRWYDSFVGKRCTGRKCPHLGTAMLESNGILVCPLHNLVADVESLCIVPYSKS